MWGTMTVHMLPLLQMKIGAESAPAGTAGTFCYIERKCKLLTEENAYWKEPEQQKKVFLMLRYSDHLFTELHSFRSLFFLFCTTYMACIEASFVVRCLWSGWGKVVQLLPLMAYSALLPGALRLFLGKLVYIARPWWSASCLRPPSERGPKSVLLNCTHMGELVWSLLARQSEFESTTFRDYFFFPAMVPCLMRYVLSLCMGK